MDVVFEVAGKGYVIAEPQATILAENLRVASKSASTSPVRSSSALLRRDEEWRAQAEQVADSIEAALVAGSPATLRLEGGMAVATYRVLRLMVGADSDGAAGLRDALGAPVSRRAARALAIVRPGPHGRLSRPQMLELLVILFVLATLTIVAGVEWTSTWYILAPVIAALLGLRVATNLATDRFAWTFASVLWFAVLLVPAAVVVTLLSLLTVTVLRH